MLGEGLGGGPLKDKMLEGPDVLFPDSSKGWHDVKSVDNDKYGMRIQHMIGPFENGYQMSVIKGPHTYGGPQGLWEIAAMDKGREFIGQALLDWNDDVMGRLTLGEVYRQCLLLEKL